MHTYFAGPTCSECNEGYVRDASFLCSACPPATHTFLAIFLALFVFGSYLFYKVRFVNLEVSYPLSSFHKVYDDTLHHFLPSYTPYNPCSILLLFQKKSPQRQERLCELCWGVLQNYFKYVPGELYRLKLRLQMG